MLNYSGAPFDSTSEGEVSGLYGRREKKVLITGWHFEKPFPVSVYSSLVSLEHRSSAVIASFCRISSISHRQGFWGLLLLITSLLLWSLKLLSLKGLLPNLDPVCILNDYLLHWLLPLVECTESLLPRKVRLWLKFANDLWVILEMLQHLVPPPDSEVEEELGRYSLLLLLLLCRGA